MRQSILKVCVRCGKTFLAIDKPCRIRAKCSRTCKASNAYTESPDGTVTVHLTQGKATVIDAADLPIVLQYSWHAVERDCTWYAASSTLRRVNGEALYLHRVLVDAAPQDDVDHRDGDGLNNRRGNIRTCTNQQNRHNMRKSQRPLSSKYKGVSRVSANSWQAGITLNYKRHGLGCYRTEEEAARAYNAAAVRLHGDFANLNAIDGLSYEESISAPERNRKPGRRPISNTVGTPAQLEPEAHR